MKREPFKTVGEKIKNNWIAIDFFTKGGLFYFGLSTFIADGGIGFPPRQQYPSYDEAKKAAYDCIINFHRSLKQQEILRAFKFIKDFAQCDLFDKF
jgi:hypothetical protein